VIACGVVTTTASSGETGADAPPESRRLATRRPASTSSSTFCSSRISTPSFSRSRPNTSIHVRCRSPSRIEKIGLGTRNQEAVIRFAVIAEIS
jgi:hypothetical protein